jgi:molybdate/tungstate transport system substrate-binding protein
MRKFVLLLFIGILVVSTACRSTDDINTLRIIHAGSLSLVVKDVVAAFQKEYPDVTILTESWGSKDGARQITELNKPCDVYISADDRIIESFLFPDHASWSIPFAGNEMVIAYTDASRFADSINQDNWFEILSRPDVLTARSSPDADPCGVRSVLVMLLSDHYYHDSAISDQLISKDHNFIRPKEADLIAMLEKGSVDYLYLYRSMAEQHGFLYVKLPEQVNLSNPEFAPYYGQVSFYTAGSSPGSTHLEVGAPIVYGVTIPHRVLNQEVAEEFVRFMLDPEKGGVIIDGHGQNMLSPQAVTWYDNVPAALRQFIRRAE